jgi:hypothetical protein
MASETPNCVAKLNRVWYECVVQICLAMTSDKLEELKSKYGEEAKVVELLKNCVSAAEQHKAMIEKWGRFPHRCADLSITPTLSLAQTYAPWQLPALLQGIDAVAF